MSLRDMTRIVLHGGAKEAQSAGERASRSIKDSTGGGGGTSPSSSNRARRLTSSIGSSRNLNTGFISDEVKRQRAEEVLRTVMFLSCWGPN
ncbi:hypothetical protein MA16_Dca014933 [Dendrobium catenatum]|uniref:Uncharacterized protein n=1 Tax=Dendrobium catenatum TaxID=906689 RepID=A0A2I0W2T7_9ASPA|nr:hypothetical protein MA16_Dca014933 [Dendrobium catenatum]